MTVLKTDKSEHWKHRIHRSKKNRYNKRGKGTNSIKLLINKGKLRVKGKKVINSFD